MTTQAQSVTAQVSAKPSTASGPSLDQAKQKLAKLRAELSQKFLEREPVIDAMLAGALMHNVGGVFVGGAPGTAKTDIALAISKHFGVLSGYRLFTQETTVGDLVGHLDFAKLRDGDAEIKFHPDGAGSTFLFIADEIWKTTSGTANALLGLLNEGRVFNGNSYVDAPLSVLIGMSNELPQEDGMEAIWDRFKIRLWVGNASKATRRELVRRDFKREWPEITTYLSESEVSLLRDHVRTLPVNSKAPGKLNKILDATEALEIETSNRRHATFRDALCAYAVVYGHDELSDVAPLQHMLWNELNEIEPVRKAVLKVACPDFDKISKTFDAVNASYDKLRAQYTTASTTKEQSQILSLQMLNGNAVALLTKCEEFLEKAKPGLPDGTCDGLEEALGLLSKLTNKALEFCRENSMVSLPEDLLDFDL